MPPIELSPRLSLCSGLAGVYSTVSQQVATCTGAALFPPPAGPLRACTGGFPCALLRKALLAARFQLVALQFILAELAGLGELLNVRHELLKPEPLPFMPKVGERR